MSYRIDELLLQAAEMNASDLHISEGGPVIVRIAGALTRPGSVQSGVYSLFEPILPDKQRAALRQDGECDFAYALSSGHRFRINLYRSMERLCAAVRIIPNSIPTCHGLGLPEALRKLSELELGIQGKMKNWICRLLL